MASGMCTLCRKDIRIHKEYTVITVSTDYCRHFNTMVIITILWDYRRTCGPGSSVSIATDYGLDGPGIESRWGRDFLHLSRLALGPTQPPVKWVPGLSRGKSVRVVTLTPHPLLVPWSRKSRAIPLLHLWALRPVQSLSASKRVHFTFHF